ncbi:aminopeptidase I zinc metalloprotease [Plectosphaerella plurivora]|uniref:aspartyl aminopeptidase n=1 Tax=Plectosphaerella plurivora TaxID=936078 RepID=A0A9P8VCX3_9PEZI|nr:aminopeptidase I zinc metalloprotease [Plectosphaerella plurivora]
MAPPKLALDFVDFVEASPTPYHACAVASIALEEAGFTKIRERDAWGSALRPGGKYYLTRNGSSIVAFAIGRRWRPGNPVAMIGAHTDSPCLRIKPVSKKSNVGFLQVGVETYGGGIWHSWFDRDLSVAGRVLVKDAEGNFTQRLVKVDKPLLRIPTLAIHLDRSTNFDPNKENELFPIAGLASAELNKTADGTSTPASVVLADADPEDASTEDFKPLKAMTERHHPHLLEVVASHADCAVSDIVDFELVLYDTQKPCLGGLNDEFIYSARLDNLNMTYCAIAGLIESVSEPDALEDDASIRLVTCFDHEEIGSTSAHGANSNLLPAVLRRLSVLPADDNISETSYDDVNDAVSHLEEGIQSTAYEQTLARSFLVSADMAHSVHPNYAGKYEPSHQPAMNGGTVIKINANQRYATNSPGIVLLQECARLAGVPLQLFVVRNDSPCGSTIGPMLSAKLGVRTLDLGNPQLSMHSIRETGGTHDVEHAVKLFKSFYQQYAELEAKILVD